MARLPEHVDAGEDAEAAHHALESEATAHEDQVQHFPETAVDGLEYYTIGEEKFTINKYLATADEVVEETIVTEPARETTTRSHVSHCLQILEKWETFLSTIFSRFKYKFFSQ